jgi:Mrp family chromosome partitioning ATPase
MRSRYDMIILDSPPALAVSDALVLSHVADAVLFLVRWGETPRRSAVDGMNSFHSHGRKVSGVVLSRVNVDKYSTYGRAKAGYYYGADGNGYAPLPTKS